MVIGQAMISRTLRCELATPPYSRAPPEPLKVVVPAALLPMRILPVVCEVVAASMAKSKVRRTRMLAEDTWALATARALAPLSWKSAIASTPLAELAAFALAIHSSRLAADLGV